MIRSILSPTDTKGTPSSLLEQSGLFIICNQKRCKDSKTYRYEEVYASEFETDLVPKSSITQPETDRCSSGHPHAMLLGKRRFSKKIFEGHFICTQDE